MALPPQSGSRTRWAPAAEQLIYHFPGAALAQSHSQPAQFGHSRRSLKKRSAQQRPVLDREISDSSELARIVRDQRQAETA